MLTETSESPTPPEGPEHKRAQGLLSLLAPSILFIAAMAAGAVIGTTAPGVTTVLSPLVDPLILILLTLLLIEVRLEGVHRLVSRLYPQRRRRHCDRRREAVRTALPPAWCHLSSQ